MVSASLLVACSGSEPIATAPDIAGVSGEIGEPEHWFAAPDGSPAGNGTAEHPWSLDSALAGGRKVAGVRPVGPGDTVWIRGGVYHGRFNTTRGGEPGHRVVYMAVPGERVILDGNSGQPSSTSLLAVQSDWVEIRGLEVMHANPSRTAPLPNVISNYGSHNRFVRLVLHDGGNGFYNEHDAGGTEIVDCIVYNNGWFSGGEGHGHGLYLKSDAGPVTATGNVVFNQFGFGIHAFSDAGSSRVDSVIVRDNVVFNNSAVHGGRRAANILMGGVTGFGALSRSAIEYNLAWYDASIEATNVKIGYDTTRNRSVSVTGNFFAGGLVVMDVRHFDAATVVADTMVGNPGDTSRVVALYAGASAGFTWRDNRYFNVAGASPRWRHLGTSYPLDTWHARTGFTTDSAGAGAPARVHVSAGSSGSGRAVISAFNAGSSITITLPPGVLAPGDSFDIRNVQRLASPPVLAGRFGGGSLAVPLAAVTPDVPRNWSAAGPGTGSALHVLVLEKR